MVYKNIIGKWNKNKYVVINKVGQGGIGEVYKVRDRDGNIKAIKLSKDIASITREFYIMKEITRLKCLPQVYEMDDYENQGENFSFIVMEYIDGINLKNYINKYDIELKDILGIALITFNMLNKLYKIGFLYADIKLENTLIDSFNKRVVFVDFGGVVPLDRNINEYTLSYNMNSWGVGLSIGRRFGIIFSVTMLIVSMLLKKEFNPLTDSIESIIDRINSLKINDSIKKFIIKGLKVKYKELEDYKKDLDRLVYSNLTYSYKEKFDCINAIFTFSIFIFLLTIIMYINYCN